MNHGAGQKKKLQGQQVWPYLFAAPYVLCYLLFSLFPTLYSLFLSFFDWNGISEMKLVGLHNYANLLTKDALFWKALGNTFTIIIVSIPLSILLGLLVANFIFNLRRSKRLFETIIFAPYVIAPIAIGAIFMYIFDWQFGYLNEILMNLGFIQDKVCWLQSEILAKPIISMVEIWRHVGYCMIIYLAGMTAISEEIYDAAKIDGADNVQTFLHITVPQLHNLTIFLTLTSIVNGMQLFEMPLRLFAGNTGIATIGGPGYSALTIIWKFVDDAFGTKMRMGYGAALCYTLFVIIVIITFTIRKIGNRKEDSV